MQIEGAFAFSPLDHRGLLARQTATLGTVRRVHPAGAPNPSRRSDRLYRFSKLGDRLPVTLCRTLGRVATRTTRQFPMAPAVGEWKAGHLSPPASSVPSRGPTGPNRPATAEERRGRRVRLRIISSGPDHPSTSAETSLQWQITVEWLHLAFALVPRTIVQHRGVEQSGSSRGS